MIQLLVALIEWFAVTGLAALGIVYEPHLPCAAPEPTEFRQAVVWIPDEAYDTPEFTAIASGDCVAGSEVLIQNTKSDFLTPSDRYDS